MQPQPVWPSGKMDRRRFLQGASALAVGSAFAAEPSVSEGCFLGFSTYGMKSLKTEAALRELSQIGFDAVELTVREGWDADSAVLASDRRAALRRQLDESSLTLTSLMEHVPPGNDQQQVFAKERLKHAAELAHALSPERPPLVQTVLGSGSFADLKTVLVDRLGEWLDIANRSDTSICPMVSEPTVR